ncbi:16S rRNA processing protein RimM [Deinococcus reticulitermitis]|uniref:Ribosome maturation factor RimM n=1 Tax=Deinococcus reticulitermitis TaxID=856736 RepID=A0A1H6WY48_9DEIO|nr:ribosome maturation factor RimM [Deinococcus reticulitermitis]SEJ21759.1 16S rRNA processing protein RimM [Deinococcus reticulitermitis]
MSEPTTRLGHLLGPHGVQGGIKLYVLGDPAQVEALRRVYVERRGWLALRRTEALAPGVVLHLAGVTSREAAEELRGLHVYAADAELPALEEGSFYYHDLRGLTVYGAAGERLGEVHDVMDAGHQDLLVVDYGGGTSFVPLQAPYVEIEKTGGKPGAVRLTEDAPAGLIGPEPGEDAEDRASGSRS